MVYLFESRLKSKIERISWFVIYIIPVFLLSYALSSVGTLSFIILFIMAVLSFFSLYEVGYIENDIKTTLNEKNPTIRIIQSKQYFLEKNYYVIQFFKILITLVLIFSIKFFSESLGIKIYLVQFVICLFFMRVSFFAHNKIRSRVDRAYVKNIEPRVFSQKSPALIFRASCQGKISKLRQSKLLRASSVVVARTPAAAGIKMNLRKSLEIRTWGRR